jgi:signal transduction histidine kinase
MRLRDLSLRYKIPLRVSALVVGTAVIVTGALILREYDEVKHDLAANATTLGRVLANTLVVPLTHDDVWRAFELINSPFSAGNIDGYDAAAELILVVNPQHQIYVSTEPTRYPMLTELKRVGRDFEILQEQFERIDAQQPTLAEVEDSDYIYVRIPVLHDKILLGTLVIAYSKSVFIPRFYSLVYRAVLGTLAVLAVLLPICWYWGHMIGVPFVRLAQAMGTVGSRLPQQHELVLYEGGDEVGQVGRAFRGMVEQLREKADLEQQVMASERLAAVGRLSAGIAHEINNPLGGMLNAISTYKRHGGDPALTDKTISLLERGLLQIKDTVAALLVEARLESHPLTPQDIEDVRTLIQPAVHRKSARLAWESEVAEALPLPSTLVRQILINLLLNAGNAVEESGCVEVRITREGRSLAMMVTNDGKYITAERLPYLFEPFSQRSDKGQGLGLWVTYQIVQQLRGEISVKSEPGQTRFTVNLPLQEDA